LGHTAAMASVASGVDMSSERGVEMLCRSKLHQDLCDVKKISPEDLKKSKLGHSYNY